MNHFLNATGRLTPYKAQIGTLMGGVLKKYKMIHPLKPFDIVIAENKTRVNPGQGVGGLTSTAYELYVTLDLDEKDINTKIDKHLPPIIAHELTHLLRAQKGLPIVPYCRLGDDIVGEGLADHLSLTLYPEQESDWINGLSKKDFDRMKAKFIKEWQSEQYDRIAWIYGAEYVDIPYCTGYTLGYAVVKDYLEKSGTSITDSLLISTDKVMSAWV